MVDAADLKSAAARHVGSIPTGGTSLTAPLIYEHVDEHVPEVPEVLRFMVEQQKMGMKEACATLKLGVGYVAIVKPHDVDQVFETARVAGFEAFDAGVVERGEQEVIVPELGISYHHDE